MNKKLLILLFIAPFIASADAATVSIMPNRTTSIPTGGGSGGTSRTTNTSTPRTPYSQRLSASSFLGGRGKITATAPGNTNNNSGGGGGNNNTDLSNYVTIEQLDAVDNRLDTRIDYTEELIKEIDELLGTKADADTVYTKEEVDELLKNAGNGQPGADGLSAYQIAVANGFVGTETQWLESLRGADGDGGTETLVDVMADGIYITTTVNGVTRYQQVDIENGDYDISQETNIIRN